MPRYSIPTLFSRALSAFGSGVQKRFATTKIPPAGQLFLRNIVEEKAIKHQENQLASGLADLPIQVREAARNKAHKEVRKNVWPLESQRRQALKKCLVAQMDCCR